MRQNNCELRVLVKGKPVTEYPHQGQFYIEGRENSEFELEFKNWTGQRVLAVLSVDGLSVMDGKAAGPNSTGYLVNPQETLRIPGWTLSQAEVAKFVFAGKDATGDKSYVAQSGGDTHNKGVIGVLVYGEKNRNIWPQPFQGARGIQISSSPTWYSGNINTGTPSPVPGHSFSGGPPAYGANAGSWHVSSGGTGMSSGGSFGGSDPYLTGAAAGSNMVSNTVNNATAMPRGLTPDVTPQTLGTGFGEATQFSTTLVNFERGDLLSMIVLYYDDRKGLKQRGINITRPSRRKYAVQPQPFPGLGCTPPPNWKG